MSTLTNSYTLLLLNIKTYDFNVNINLAILPNMPIVQK